MGCSLRVLDGVFGKREEKTFKLVGLYGLVHILIFSFQRTFQWQMLPNNGTRPLTWWERSLAETPVL